MLKKIFLMFSLLIEMSFIFGEQRISNEDSKLLKPLFRLLLECSEAGYVFYDKKPICTVSYSQKPFFFDQFESYEQLSVAVYSARQRLKDSHFQLKNIVFHFDEENEMLLIINRKLLLSTIKDNLALFQYILGPTTTPEFILESILSSKKSFFEVLGYERVLIGITLGYGLQNALFASRLENIQYDATGLLDIPPFIPQSSVCLDESSKESMLFFDHEENPRWKKRGNFLKPSAGFASLKQEKEYIENKLVISSESLRVESPNFIFACLEESQAILRNLEHTQTKIKHLLQSNEWFEKTFALIFDDTVVIESTEIEDHLLSKLNINKTIAKLLREELSNKYLDQRSIEAFIKGLMKSAIGKDVSGGSILYKKGLENVKMARQNLDKSNLFFKKINKNYTPLLKSYLYYKILESGAGSTLKNESKVCLDFEIFDSLDRYLNTAKSIVINLTETIPGFAQGIRGMKVGEKREILIHPALAYGVHTYLEKGIHLKAIVKLHEIFNEKNELPDLKPSDFSLIQNDHFLNQCLSQHEQAIQFIGFNKGQFLRQCPGIDIDSIAQYIQTLSDDDITISNEESDDLNRFFWNLYFSDQK